MVNTRFVEETPYGVYVWEMPDGRWVADDQRNFMCIAARKGDQKRIEQMKQAARSYGITEGRPVFLSGHRKVSDEEYEEQRARLANGEIPDEYDVPAIRENNER